VLFTARNGATLSGHVWATTAGPAKRPGVVITNGSVQANEPLYWFAAQALAKAGYVVMTFDPQGQGQSDLAGEGADQGEGVPAQSDGRPFFDGTEDALNFFFSTQAKPYEPVPSCNSGTSHAAMQDRRVQAGLDTAYNPYAGLLDRSRVGIAGHSYGAAGVSYVGQADPRVKAVVAWDNLSATADGIAGLLQGGRRHRRGHHPRRLAPGLLLHLQCGVRSQPARRRHGRLRPNAARRRCAYRRRVVIRLPRVRVKRVVARSRGRVVGRSQGRRVVIRLPRRTATVRLVVTLRSGRYLRAVRRYRRC
jgi:dienelactone hydrolase